MLAAGPEPQSRLQEEVPVVTTLKPPCVHSTLSTTQTSCCDFLPVDVTRYYVASDWTPKKLNVEVQMPDTLDLESLRARGPQPGEQLQPEGPTGDSFWDKQSSL